MTFRSSQFAGAAAMAAALSMAATPAAALDMPTHAASVNADAQVLPVDAGEANQWRRHRDYRPYRHHRNRNRGIDAGDVVAGVVVLGALAAILGSSNNSRDRDHDRRQRVRYDDPRDRDYESRGIESAVDMCVDQVEYRDSRVESVDRADRSARGWDVSGLLENGERWTCFIDNAGQVRSIDYGQTAFSQAPAASAAGQLSDAAYRNARASTRTAADEPYRYEDAPVTTNTRTTVATPRPAYPGGPLPGEEGYDEDWQPDDNVDVEEDDAGWESDGRYTTAQAPDFEQPAR